MWIATVANRVAIPAAYIEKLLAAGYIHEGITGTVLTDLGERLLARRRARRTAQGRHPCGTPSSAYKLGPGYYRIDLNPK
jgi:hypothetical protein